MKKILGLLLMLGLMVSFGGCGKNGPTRFVEYYENGQVEVEGNRKDGERDGKWGWYYESGQIGVEENYKDGELKKRVWYDEEGNITSEGCYDMGEYVVCP